MTILIDSQGELSGYRYIDNVGKRIKYDVEDILHIKLSNSLETEREMKFWGLSPLRALWSVVSASDDLFTARAAIWKNKGYAGILTNKSDTPLLPKERNDLQDSFNDEIGGADRANGVRVSTGNLSYLQLGMSPQDLQLLEGNIDNLRMISASYKTSSILYNDVANSTYNNVLESKRDAYTDAYIPLDEKVNEKLGPWLSDILGVEETIVVDTTRIEVLKLTTNEVANRLNNLPTNVAARVMEAVTINESRDLIGLDTIDKGEEMLGKSNNKEDEKSPK
jgi:phage portal protein BeeE